MTKPNKLSGKAIQARLGTSFKSIKTTTASHIPSRQQYKKWTMPSKYALWGVIVGILSLALGIGTIFLTGGDPVAAAKGVEVDHARARINSGLIQLQESFDEQMKKSTKAHAALGAGGYVMPTSPMQFFNPEDIDLIHGPERYENVSELIYQFYWPAYTRMATIAQYIEQPDAYKMMTSVVDAEKLMDSVEESMENQGIPISRDDPVYANQYYLTDIFSGKFGDIDGLKVEYEVQRGEFRDAYEEIVALLSPDK